MKAEKYFNEVYKNSAWNQKRSLDNLKEVCDFFEKENLRIRLMAVGRECKKRFQMTSQNTLKANKYLKEYLDLRAREQKIDESEPCYSSFINERIKYLELENRKLRELLKKVIVADVDNIESIYLNENKGLY